MTTEETCTREDIEAIVNMPSRWSVDVNGDLVNFLGEGDSSRQADEYVCDKCDEFFDTWEAALAHVKEAV